MKILAVCSYLCSALILLCWLILAEEIIGRINSSDDNGWFFLLFIVPPVLQIVYTSTTSTMLRMVVFRESKVLDDFAMNEFDNGDRVVSTGFWLKAFSTINSLLLCLYFLICTFLFSDFWKMFRQSDSSDASGLSLLFFLLGYLFSIPTIVYNLRTFNLKRIKREKPGGV
jgi:hypothetical protein